MISIAFLIWLCCGITGYILYLSNKNTRPKKIHLLLIALMTHLCFGIVALLYGYMCYSNRNIVIKK